MKLWTKMLIGLVLGVLVGIFFGPQAAYLKPIGTAFLGLLSMVVLLLVFSSMTVGVTAINDVRKLGRVGLKTLSLYVGTTVIAIALGLLAAKLINPGQGFSTLQTAVAPVVVAPTPEFSQLFLNLIPSNPIGALASGNVLQVIIFSIFLGLGITMVGDKGRPMVQLLESLYEVMIRITAMVMNLAPYGIFAIMAWVSGTFGIKILLPLCKLVLTHYLVCIFHLVIVYGGILLLMAKLRVIPFFKGLTDAITVAASTTSSLATLPALMHGVERNLGVSQHISRFILPLGSTVNMNGTAIFQAIATVFVAQVYGVELGWQSLLVIVVTATLGTIGCVGIPGGALVTLSLVLGSVGLPLEGIAIIAGIDRLRDIIGTVVNVLGDAVVAVYVAKTEGELDEERYHNGSTVSYTDKAVATEETLA